MEFDSRITATGRFIDGPFFDPVLKLLPGTQLKLEHGEDDERLNFNGILAGMTPGECLIVRIFPTREILSRLNEGESLFVRYVSQDDAYAFNSTIRSSIVKPVMMVFLEYPAEVKTWNLRKSPRFPCVFSATIKEGKSEYRAVVVNISEGGCKVCMDNYGAPPLPFEVGQKIRLCFYETESAMPIEINSTIKYLRKDTHFLELGVEFGRLNGALPIEVNKFISGIINNITTVPS
ncbi:MAG: flagellar brake protein [Syntrophobacteraceae bacterium]